MAAKKKKRDLLEDILGGPQDDSAPGVDELTKLIHRDAQPTEIVSGKRVATKKGRKTTKKKRPRKKKTTHYLSKEIFENLGEAKEKIRDIIPSDKKIRVTKSGIVNSALKMLLKEFELKKEKSLLVKQILEGGTKK
jgi:hypothetical protein